jgi:gamma-glutamyl:cysteine ligase YbdK (ATP-grasp superfamily)
VKNKESELINTLLKNFLESASMEEIEELYKLLESRKNRFKGMSLNIDTQAMAKAMSESIQEQLGMANLNIKKMARELVAQLAIQHNPDISQDELNAIINHMVLKKDNPLQQTFQKIL